MAWVKGKGNHLGEIENDVKVLEYNFISCQFTAAILSVSSNLGKC